MTNWREIIAELNPDALLIDSFDEAIVGHVEQSSKVLAAYSKEVVLDILHRQGMTEEEAIEHFDFNIIGSYVGENTPVFLTAVVSE
jgi:hypothetical protein